MCMMRGRLHLIVSTATIMSKRASWSRMSKNANGFGASAWKADTLNCPVAMSLQSSLGLVDCVEACFTVVDSLCMSSFRISRR